MHALIAINELKSNIESRARNVLPKEFSIQQFMLLTAISTQKNLSCDQACEETGLLGPSCARMIKNLKDLGFIKDMPCPDDGRIKRLSVTTNGGKFYRKYRTRVGKAVAVKLTDLNDVAAIITSNY